MAYGLGELPSPNLSGVGQAAPAPVSGGVGSGDSLAGASSFMSGAAPWIGMGLGTLMNMSSARKGNRAKEAERSRYRGLLGQLGSNPFPNFYSGVQGRGDQVRLDPRFRVNQYGSTSSGASFENLLSGLGEPRERKGILDSALDDYDTASTIRRKGTEGSLAATGRGLLDIDRAGLKGQQMQSDVGNRQQLRNYYEQEAAKDAVESAKGDIGLLGRLPRIGTEVNLVDQVNANRLLSEIGALANYNNTNYRAKLAEQQGADIQRAAR